MKFDGLHIFSTPHVWQLTPTDLPFHPLISEFMIFSFFFRDVHLPLGVGFMIVNFVCYTRLHERRVHKSFFSWKETSIILQAQQYRWPQGLLQIEVT
jgi:hypothetical protein